jgi:hypothetical protein
MAELIPFGWTEAYSAEFDVGEHEEVTLHLKGDGDANAHVLSLVHLQIGSSTGSFQNTDRLTGAKAAGVLRGIGRYRLYRPECQPAMACGAERSD